MYINVSTPPFSLSGIDKTKAWSHVSDDVAIIDGNNNGLENKSYYRDQNLLLGKLLWLEISAKKSQFKESNVHVYMCCSHRYNTTSNLKI